MKIDINYLNDKRREGDQEADNLVRIYFEKGQEKALYSHLKLSSSDIKHNPEANEIKNFLAHSRHFPDWYSESKLIEGQKFYKRLASEIMMLLGAMSLPYCYAASPGNKALFLTGKIYGTPGKRLIETAQFIIAVMTEGSFGAEGNGWLEVNKTRLIHALVRYHLLLGTSWDDAWGVPINQEDMAGTNLAFSYIILIGLKKWGFRFSESEADHFLFAWRFIGYLLHIDEELLPKSFGEAAQLEQSIKLRHFHASEEGRMLAAGLMNHYKSALPALGAYFVDGQIRYFLGREIAELLGLQKENLKDVLVVFINKVTFFINRRRTVTSSYERMITDHERLKALYLQ